MPTHAGDTRGHATRLQQPVTRADMKIYHINQLKKCFAFTTNVHWQYWVLPSGLHGAPATLQRLLDIMLHKHRTFAAAYVDDMVLHASSWLDHLFHLGDVLKKLRKAAATQKNLT